MSKNVRDELRSAIFSSKSKERKRVPAKIGGMDIELVEPTVSDLLEKSNTEDNASALIQSIIKLAHVPGTNERVFEEGDAAALKTLPYNEELQHLVNQITVLMGGSHEEQVKN